MILLKLSLVYWVTTEVCPPLLPLQLEYSWRGRKEEVLTKKFMMCVLVHPLELVSCRAVVPAPPPCPPLYPLHAPPAWHLDHVDVIATSQQSQEHISI